MTGPDRLWLNLNHADQQRHGVSFVTKGPLAGPPYTKYVRADVVDEMITTAIERACDRLADSWTWDDADFLSCVIADLKSHCAPRRHTNDSA